MGTTQQISQALTAGFAPGERVIAWHRVTPGVTTDGRDFDAALALLGPSAYVATLSTTGSGARTVPARTSLVVVTDQRVLWCSENGGDGITIAGADPLTALADAVVVPGNRAPTRLRFGFHDRSVVHCDLSSDRGVDEFIATVTELLNRIRSAA